MNHFALCVFAVLHIFLFTHMYILSFDYLLIHRISQINICAFAKE